MPPLSEADYAALKADIAERGIMVPIEVDENGEVLDGHHRVKICDELGIHCQRFVREGMDDAGKRTHARRLNIARRHLSDEQKVALVSDEIAANPDRSNREIAAVLGVSHPFVAKVREELEKTTVGNGFQLKTRKGKDGKNYKAKKPRKLKPAWIDFDEGDTEAAAAVKKSASKAKAKDREKKRAAAASDNETRKAGLPEIEGRYRIFQADISSADIEPHSIDAIITDPPYPAEFLPLYDVLADNAAEWLRPGGTLAVMCGTMFLPEVFILLTGRLRYRWTFAYLTPGGQAAQIFPRRINQFWKPVIVYVNGDPKDCEWAGDVTRSDVNDNDKEHHHWGQSVSGMTDIIGRLTRVGDLILDPFMGAATTGVSALLSDRRFIGFDIDQQHVDTAASRLSEAADAEL